MRFGATNQLATAMTLLGLALGTGARAAPAQIDAAVQQQIIRGFGGATVFRPTVPLTEAELDALYGTGPGQIGFTLLRIRVAADAPWRALELVNAKGVRARGGEVIATPWSPPPEMKSNNSLIDGSLNRASYADYAKYLNDFALYMAANGAPLYAISVQNEPDIDVDYESCVWTPAQMLEFCRDHAGAISATRVIAPESFQFRRAMADPLLNDSRATANIDIVGGHIYGAGLAPYPLAAARAKELWMTEHLDLSTDWAGALATAREIHDCLAVANFSAYLWWYVVRYYGPLGEDGLVTKRGFVMAQFARFIRPGYVRIGATTTPTPGVSVSAYQREKLVIVAVNQNAAPVTQEFSIANAQLNTVTPWVTSSTADLAPQPAIPVTARAFTATLPAQSVTTFVGEIIFPPPVIVAPPESHGVGRGSTAVLDVATSGEQVTFQWHRNGARLPGATNRLLTLTGVREADAGSYTVTATNSGGSVTSAPAVLRLAETPGRLMNLSTRAQVGPGERLAIAGFVITGNAPRPVLVRAAGPALGTGFGLAGVLADPVIELRDGATGAVVASNDDWEPRLETNFTAVGAFGWPRCSRDAALLASPTGGSYTALVRGRDDGTGVALVEVYDADSGPGSALINLSARATVATGENVQIGGFVVRGGAATVVIRAAGPALRKSFGVAGVLEDPTIELRAADGRLIATADDWEGFLAPHFSSVGAFPWLTGSRDAALVATLEPGAYSVVVRGKAQTSGVALLEIYATP